MEMGSPVFSGDAAASVWSQLHLSCLRCCWVRYWKHCKTWSCQMFGTGCIRPVAEISTGCRWQAKSSHGVSGNSSLFSDHREQVRFWHNQHLEKCLSHQSPRWCLANLTWSSSDPAWCLCRGDLCSVVGFNLLPCAVYEQLLESGGEALAGPVGMDSKQALLCLLLKLKAEERQ